MISMEHCVICCKSPVATFSDILTIFKMAAFDLWHDAVTQDINVDILAMCSGDAMLRPVTEAVFINQLNPTLNTKKNGETRTN